jgi:hypothetical protein
MITGDLATGGSDGDARHGRRCRLARTVIPNAAILQLQIAFRMELRK